MAEAFNYTVVIRTLGMAGEKYQKLLDTLCIQTIQPEKILVYIAEGYAIPKETCGKEEYIRCPKGMIAQRSLSFDEVETEWILFCDDDISFEKDSVERLYNGLVMMGTDSMCISPDTFPNHKATVKQKLKYCALLTFPHWRKNWAFRIRESCHYSYNNNPSKVLRTQSAAFPCCLIKKEAYKKIHFEDERFLDDFKYALGDDLLFFYKLYRMGFVPLVHFDSGVVHQDAGTSHIKNEAEIFRLSNAASFTVWHRSRYLTHKSFFGKMWCAICYWTTVFSHILCFTVVGIVKRNFTTVKFFVSGIRYGVGYVKSEKYKSLVPYLAHLEDR